MGDGSAFFRHDKAHARLVRRRCDNCGSAAIRWGVLSEIILLAVDIPVADRVAALDVFGSRADAWLCVCGNFGVFSGWFQE